MQPEIVGELSFTKVTLGEEQLSKASVTTALFGLAKVPLQPEISIEVGFEAVGKVVSIVRIKFCVTLMKFPHASVILYVRMVVSVQPETVGELSFTKVTLVVEQLSDASVTTAIFGLAKVPLQPEISIEFGLEAVGDVVSMVRIKFCVTFIKFPHSSVTLYVRMVVSVQPETVGKLSFTKVTFGVEQLSKASDTTAIFGGENVPLQPEISIEVGFEAVGKVVSMVLIKF